MPPVPDVPDDSLDLIGSMLARVLAVPLAGQPEALAGLCAEHPDFAAALRRGYASLQQLGLEQVGQADPQAPTAEPTAGGLPRNLGPFRLLEFLGAGGMGTVYRAEDLELKRPVALKLVRSELLASARTRTRFQHEAAALARLDHPGLCTVHRAGTTDGQPWIAMRLVRGTTLAAEIEARRQAETTKTPPGPAARRGSSNSREDVQRMLLLFEKIARALATAHAAGVVHRDLKPANIVLTDGGEPVVIDFGLVHLTDSESQLTLSGDHIGTPAYMAPEQVEARGRAVAPATDVFALAVTLFEALTLQSPYQAQGREELFHCIVRGERRRLRQAGKGLPADLDVVIEKALDLDPARRYASMVEFADDLRRIRQHEPPTARRIGLPLRLRRWCQRNPVAATFLTLLSLGLGTAFALERSRQAAQTRTLAMAYGNLAGQILDKSPERALDLALRSVALAPGNPESLGALLQALEQVRANESWFLPWPNEPRVTVLGIVPSPQGDAAVILGQYPTNAFPEPVLWRPTGCTKLPIEKGTLDAHWSPDGSRFVTTCPYAPPQLWSAAGDRLDEFAVPGVSGTLKMPRGRFLSDGDHIVFACSDGIARILDLRTRTWQALAPALCEKDKENGGMPGLAVSADGKRLALGDLEGRIVVHEVAAALADQPGRLLTNDSPKVFELDLGATGDLLQVKSLAPQRCTLWTWRGEFLKGWGSRDAPATAMPLAPSGNFVLEVAQDHMPFLWEFDGKGLTFRHALAQHDGQVTQGRYAADGLLLTLGVDGTARLTDPGTGRPELTLRGFTHELRAAAFLGATTQCLVATTNAVHRFDLAPVTGPRLHVGAFAHKHARFVGDAWRPATIVTADIARTLTLHDADGRTVQRSVVEPFARRAGLGASVDGRWIVSTSHLRSRETEARIYGPGLVEVQRIPLTMDAPQPIFGPADQLLLVDLGQNARDDCAVHVPDGAGRWQPAAPDVQQAFREACGGARAVAFHAGTGTLAVARDKAGVTLYRWSASPPALAPAGPPLLEDFSPRLIAFDPGGERLLLACTDRVVRLVDRTNVVLARYEGHLGTVETIEISPRGDRLLIAATDSGITVHDLQGNLQLPIRPPGSVSLARFLPDGEHILYGDTSRTTRIVPIEQSKLVELARAVTRPEMTQDEDQHYRARAGDTRSR